MGIDSSRYEAAVNGPSQIPKAKKTIIFMP